MKVSDLREQLEKMDDDDEVMIAVRTEKGDDLDAYPLTGIEAIENEDGEEAYALVADLSDEDGEADTTFECKLETFQAILEGRQDPSLAFMMGKMKVRGSMGLAMKLNAILED